MVLSTHTPGPQPSPHNTLTPTDPQPSPHNTLTPQHPHPNLFTPNPSLPLPPSLQYLHSYKQLMSSEVDTANEGQHRTRLAEVEMSLEALSNVIRNNNGELQRVCNGH